MTTIPTRTLSAPSPMGHLEVLERPADGPPQRTVVLLHGLPTCKEMWLDVVSELPPQWRVLAPDLPDFGQSTRAGRRHLHPERAAALRAAIVPLVDGPFDFVAHDLGASVAVQWFGDFGTDGIARIVLLSPPVYPDFTRPVRVALFSAPGVGELLAPLGKRWILPMTIKEGMAHAERFGSPFRESLQAAFAGRDGTAALLRCLRWGHPRSSFAPYPATLKALDRPTLVVQGRRDPWIPGEHAERLAADVPDARLVWIEDGGHFLPLDTPTEVAAALVDFLH